MEQLITENSPVVYYVSGRDRDEWVLFIHAAFVDHRMFTKQIDYFKSKYNVLAVDIIGHGKSVETKKGDSISKMSDWINDILKAEYIEKLHIVGVSLGSVIAQDFANRYPGAVSSLACFGGYDINNFDVETQKKNGSAQALMMLKAMFSVKWFAKANKKISAYTTQAQEEFYEMNIRFPKRSFMYLSALNSMVNKFQTKPREYPLLIGCGQFDIPLELEILKEWKKREPAAKVVILENAGHCVNMDVPLEFNSVMYEFWGKKI